MKSSLLNFIIYIIFYCIKDIISTSERKPHFGKCVYISKNTGSQIINFNKYKNRDYSPKNESFQFNLCHDTIYTKWENGSKETKVDSQIVYKNDNLNISTRLTGPFHYLKDNSWKNETILLKAEGVEAYTYKAQYGDFCNENKKNNYSTSIIYVHKNIDEEKLEVLEFPDINNCNPILKLSFNKEYATDYLLLQKVLNDLYIPIGIIFILLGIFLCFFSLKFKSITKILISIVFGQLIIFNIALIFIGNYTALKDYLCILIIGLGLIISIPFIYFSRTKEKLYSIILSFSSGYIFGIFVYEILFFNTNSSLSNSILIDVILIFTTLFIGLYLIIKKNNSIYYPPFIGSYILIRGLSLLIYNATDKGGFGDLQLLIYLINLREYDLVYDYFDNDYKYFYIYLIAIGLILIASEVAIFFLKTESDLEESNIEIDEPAVDMDVSFETMNKLVDK